MKKLLVAFFWLLTTMGVVLSGVALAYKLESGHFLSARFSISWQNWPGKVAEDKLLDGSPGAINPQIQAQQEIGDARVILVHNFLERHASPILVEDPEFAHFLVELADSNNMDFRLLPAIAMQESNLCKVIPADSHNCLGLGVHARGTWGFETYRENFIAAAKVLKKNYIDIGLVTTEQIEKKYNPTSHSRDGSWASSVNQWMAEMRYDDRALGKELKIDADLLEFTEKKPTTAETSSSSAKTTPKPTIKPVLATPTPSSEAPAN